MFNDAEFHAPALQPARRTPPGYADSAAGYLVSSLELRMGLQMRAVPDGALSLDELRELLRMQASWARPPRRPA